MWLNVGDTPRLKGMHISSLYADLHSQSQMKDQCLHSSFPAKLRKLVKDGLCDRSS